MLPNLCQRTWSGNAATVSFSGILSVMLRLSLVYSDMFNVFNLWVVKVDQVDEVYVSCLRAVVKSCSCLNAHTSPAPVPCEWSESAQVSAILRCAACSLILTWKKISFFLEIHTYTSYDRQWLYIHFIIHSSYWWILPLYVLLFLDQFSYLISITMMLHVIETSLLNYWESKSPSSKIMGRLMLIHQINVHNSGVLCQEYHSWDLI